MYKIKQIPIKQRPREKALANGINTLTNKELLAILIRNGTNKYSAINIAEILLYSFNNLNNIFNANLNELIKIEGIKSVKAIEILAIGELIRREALERLESNPSFTKPRQIASFFYPILLNEKQEVFIVLFLNIKNQLIKYESLFKGGLNFSLVDINLVFKKAIELGSCKIICIHNHPSGIINPSKDDELITKKLKIQGELLNINLIDHIIIGNKNYFSFKENSLI